MPGDKFEWRPHERSFTVAELASHLVDCVGWTHSIFTKDELEIDLATFKPYAATSVPDLPTAFDDRVTTGKQGLSGVTDEDLKRPWRFKMMGRVRFEKPKAAVFRDFTLSHLIHHRGQLTVYERLLNVPVPGSYGPTADDEMGSTS